MQKPVPNFSAFDPTLASDTLFGVSVATYGDIVAVGAPGYNGEFGDKIGGSVLIYDAGTGSLQRVISNPSGTQDGFGQTIALYGDKLVVGEHHTQMQQTNAGRIYNLMSQLALCWPQSTIRAQPLIVFWVHIIDF